MNGERKAPPGEASLDAAAGLHAYRFDHTGIRRVLGPLEADVLEAVWQLTPGNDTVSAGWTTIGAVCHALGPDTNYKTIQTIMNRLVEKRVLVRRQHRRAYEYRALPTRSALEASVARNVVEGLVRDFGSVAITQLVQAVQEVEPEHLALLERLAADAQHSAVPPETLEGTAIQSTLPEASRGDRCHNRQSARRRRGPTGRETSKGTS